MSIHECALRWVTLLKEIHAPRRAVPLGRERRGSTVGGGDPVSVCSTPCQLRHRYRAMNAGKICQIAVHPTPDPRDRLPGLRPQDPSR